MSRRPRTLSGDICFDHVSFAYEQKAVLRDVSFTVKGGSTLGILGETGSGKSTIALLLARLYDPKEGKITIGGVDLREMNQTELRRGVGVVLPGAVPVFKNGRAEYRHHQRRRQSGGNRAGGEGSLSA